VKLTGPKSPMHAGINAFTFQKVTTDRFRITVTPSADAPTEIREIELMDYHGQPIGR